MTSQHPTPQSRGPSEPYAADAPFAAADELALRPIEPEPPAGNADRQRRPAFVEPPVPLEYQPRPTPPPFRFSLLELLVVVTSAAMIMALYALLLPGLGATVFGLVAILIVVGLSSWRPRTTSMRMLWWLFAAVCLVSPLLAFLALCVSLMGGA